MSVMQFVERLLPWTRPQVTEREMKIKRYDPLVASVMDDHPVRAKKEYQCPICGREIFKTQLHRRVVWRGVKDRVLHTDHVHLRCF